MNPILMCDGYKLDHRRQYPKGVERIYSNWTPRSTRVKGVEKVVFFGLQHFIEKYLEEEFDKFFDMPREKAIWRYQRRLDGYLGPNTIGTGHIGALHDLGYLPIEIKALPEGTEAPLRCPMLTIENTHDDFAWVVNYLESLLSAEMWLPCTSATTALRLRRLLDSYAKMTGAPPEFVPWQGHDFSFRGMSGVEAAALSGAAHLLSFTGTDTLPALDLIEEFYPVEKDYLIGGSVAATEHSVMCAGGEFSEMETFSRLLDLYPNGVLSVVSDTWDLWNVIVQVLPELKERIMSREGKLVIRPDSGDPVKIICGDPLAENPYARRGVVPLLGDLFGFTTNAKGYRELDPHIGVIYGDGISYERAGEILSKLAAHGYSSGNIVFGVGSYTYQFVTRDTYGFAMKATWAQIGGEGKDLFKDPKTDDGGKKSAKGRLAVMPDFRVVEKATPAEEARSILRPVWRDGRFLVREGFADIRKRLLG